MKFAEPFYLLLLAPVLCAMGIAVYYFNKQRTNLLRSFASEHLLNQLTTNLSVSRRRLKQLLFFLSISFGLIALARPQWGFHWEEVKRKGIDILIAVDTSKSMLAQDVAPDRLSRAKLAVFDLLNRLEGDRVGLIAFAGGSFLQCPLTLDYDAFRQSLEALDTSMIPVGGTNIAAAIQEAEKAFSMGNQNHKILVLITDGEDLEANGVTEAKRVADEGVKIYTVGVGTTGGELIPIKNESGGTEFVKDENGQVVKSRLDETRLKQIAEETGAFYEPLGQRGEGLERIYEKGLADIPKEELSSKMNKVYNEQFQWPLSLSILCLILEFLIGDRKKSQITKWLFPWSRSAGMALVLVFLQPFASSYAVSNRTAQKEYEKGKYEDSLKHYRELLQKKPDSPALQFNTGSAAYQCGEYDEALNDFQKSLKTDDLNLQEQAFYNLGNTQYRIGQRTEKQNPQQTIQIWQQALQSYLNALQLKKDDADAEFNFEYVKKKLSELEKNPPPPQQQQQQQQQDQNKNNDQNQNPDKSKNDDHNKNQGQPDSKSKDKQNPTQQPPSPNNGNDQKPDPKQKPNPNGETNQPPNSQGKTPTPGVGDSSSKTDQARAMVPPGEMSPEEAKSLLDSLKGDEKKMPFTGIRVENQKRIENNSKHDW